MADASTNAPALSRKPCSKRLSGQKETDQTSIRCINVWSNYGAGDRTRTGTLLPTRDFKSLVSTIPPHRRIEHFYIIYHHICK